MQELKNSPMYYIRYSFTCMLLYYFALWFDLQNNILLKMMCSSPLGPPTKDIKDIEWSKDLAIVLLYSICPLFR